MRGSSRGAKLPLRGFPPRPDCLLPETREQISGKKSGPRQFPASPKAAPALKPGTSASSPRCASWTLQIVKMRCYRICSINCYTNNDLLAADPALRCARRPCSKPTEGLSWRTAGRLWGSATSQGIETHETKLAGRVSSAASQNLVGATHFRKTDTLQGRRRYPPFTR